MTAHWELRKWDKPVLFIKGSGGGEMMEYTPFWENDTLMYMLVAVLALPAGWIAMKVLDRWDR